MSADGDKVLASMVNAFPHKKDLED